MESPQGKLIDLEEHLLRVSIDSAWMRTPEIELRAGTTDEGPWADRVKDPTRPGEFVYGPAIVVLEVAPDHGQRLIVREPV